MYTIHDAKAEAYLTPFFLPMDGMALRTFGDCVNSKDHQFGAHPYDFTLFRIGTWDDSTATVLVAERSHSLGNGVELLRTRQIELPNAVQASNDATLGDDSPVLPGPGSGNSA